MDLDSDQLAERIGQVIAVRRVACNLTQEQVADKLGVGLAAVSRLERGLIMPTVGRLVELAEILGCSATDLMSEVSTGTNDQAHRLAQVLSKLREHDRSVLVDAMERIASCLPCR